VEAIRQGKAVVVSNRSFHDQAGLVAWPIKSNIKQHQIKGYGQTLHQSGQLCGGKYFLIKNEMTNMLRFLCNNVRFLC